MKKWMLTMVFSAGVCAAVAQPPPCHACNGTGRQPRFLLFSRFCPECGGSGLERGGAPAPSPAPAPHAKPAPAPAPHAKPAPAPAPAASPEKQRGGGAPRSQPQQQPREGRAPSRP